MTPMLYPNCRDPRTAVKTERTKVPVTVWSRNTHKHRHQHLPSTVYNCDPDERHFSSVHDITDQFTADA